MKNFSCRNLPHLVPPGGEFFITASLKNAIPKAKIKALQSKAKVGLNLLKEYPNDSESNEKN